MGSFEFTSGQELITRTVRRAWVSFAVGELALSAERAGNTFDSWLAEIAGQPAAPVNSVDASPLAADAVGVADLHVSRGWAVDPFAPRCGCALLECGHVSLAAAAVRGCAQHAPGRARTIRSQHAAGLCDKAGPHTSPPAESMRAAQSALEHTRSTGQLAPVKSGDLDG